MREFRNLDQVEEEYLREHPAEIEEYLSELFEEYANDGDTAALLSSLRVVSRVKGIGNIAEETGLTRQGVQKALSKNGNPRWDSVNAIMHAMGYCLSPKKLEVHV